MKPDKLPSTKELLGTRFYFIWASMIEEYNRYNSGLYRETNDDSIIFFDKDNPPEDYLKSKQEISDYEEMFTIEKYNYYGFVMNNNKDHWN